MTTKKKEIKTKKAPKVMLTASYVSTSPAVDPDIQELMEKETEQQDDPAIPTLKPDVIITERDGVKYGVGNDYEFFESPNSSNVLGAEYTPSEQVLILHYSKASYIYDEKPFPPHLWEQFKAHPSKGGFVAMFITRKVQGKALFVGRPLE